MSDLYTCCKCGNTYGKLWSDEEAEKEYNLLYPECKNDPRDIVCDDCFKKFQMWFSEVSEKEKSEMRGEQ